MMFLLFSLLSSLFFLPGLCQSSGYVYSGTVPLAIRSPYFNIWVNATSPNTHFPVFYTDSLRTWSGLIRIDGVTWSWLGAANEGLQIRNATLKNSTVTPTRTIFTYGTEKMDLTVTFLTPIEPSDPVRQSLPFTYVALEAQSTDGQLHSVQVYSDIGLDWVAPYPFNSSQVVHDTGNTVYWTARDLEGSSLAEVAGRGTDMTLYYGTPKRSGIVTRFDSEKFTHTVFAQSGPSGLNDNGTLIGNVDVFANAFDLGSITTTQAPVVWTVGMVHNPVVSYVQGTGQAQLRYPYYASQYGDITDAIDGIFGDYSGALTRATEFDRNLLNQASSISTHYADLVSLAARQTIGSTELTISKGIDGSWNTTDIKVFMKDVGTSRRVNPVEVLWASFPFFLCAAPSYGGKLLAPLLEYQDSSLWSPSYPARDLGSNYPNTTSTLESHNQGVEQSGNMLIMVYAHSSVTGDKSFITSHYPLLKRWATYLGDNTLSPINQATADSQNRTNSTNLALKGIIGLQAMAEISRKVGNEDDAVQFSNIASGYATTWKSLALSTDATTQHALSSYGDQDSSWALIYSLYAAHEYHWKRSGQTGLRLDSTTDVTNSAWILHTAATVSDSSVRDSLIEQVWKQASVAQQFPSIYEGSNSTSGTSSPAQGGAFALLALSLFPQNQNQNPSSPASQSTKKKSVVGPVVGGVLGGLALIIAVVIATWFWKRKGKRLAPIQVSHKSGRKESKGQWHVAPFDSGLVEDSAAASIEPSQSSPNSTSTPYQEHGGTALSAKAREAGLVIANSQASSQVAPSTSAASATVASSPRPTSLRVPMNEVLGLKAEMATLKEAMRQIQTNHLDAGAPPGYNSIPRDAPGEP